jgi:hypothetical protein
MSAANPNPMEKSMVSVLVVANAGGGRRCREGDFATKINEIKVELSGNSQRYVNECCESESDGKIDGFGAGCCKRRGGVAVATRKPKTSGGN